MGNARKHHTMPRYLLALCLSLCITAPAAAQPSEENPHHDIRIATIEGLASACLHVLKAQGDDTHPLPHYLQNQWPKQVNERAYGLCYGYIRGVKNTYDVQTKVRGRKGNICPPKTATWLDMIEAFMRFAHQNPQMRKMLAWTGLTRALAQTYPCDL